MGDFNLPEIDWETESTNGPQDSTQQRFLKFVKDSFLYQHVGKPTHHRPNCNPTLIDLVFANEECMVENVEYLAPLGKSHHCVLRFNYNLYSENLESCYKSLVDKGNYEEMNSDLTSINWYEILDANQVDKNWATFSSLYKQAIAKYIPQVKVRKYGRKRKPLSSKAIEKVNKKNVAFREMMAERTESTVARYNKARNQSKWECRKSDVEYERRIAEEAKTNPKLFYSYIRGKLKTRSGIGDIQNMDGELLQEDKEKAEAFNTFFSSVFTREDISTIPTPDAKPVHKKLEVLRTCHKDILKYLRMLNPSKSPGPDSFHPRILKETAASISTPLTIIFNQSLDTGQVPADWKIAEVTPIFKKGDKTLVKNYRPISLTSIVCKTLEKVVRQQLMQHMTENTLIAPEQHGFLEGRSCTTNLLSTMEKWTEALDQGQPMDAIYLDFAKAFDTVPHQRLSRKLLSYGVEGQALNWINNFLSDRWQTVNISGQKSTPTRVISGIPQGSVLGPSLFVVYINDLPDCIDSSVELFADDSKIFRPVPDSEQNTVLQDDINSLVTWSEKWQLKFNADKCVTLHLGYNNRQHTYSMTSNGNSQILSSTTEERDLGIKIDPTLTFTKHVTTQVKKANQIVGLIRRSFDYLDIPTLKKIYTGLVRPHLEYCVVVWAPRLEKDRQLVEGVQRRVTKLIAATRDLPYSTRLKIFDLPSMEYRRIRGDMIETWKFLHEKYNLKTQLFQLNNEGPTRGHNLKIKKNYSRLEMRHKFFSNRVVDTWNNLPYYIVNSENINTFKNRIDSHWKSFKYELKLSHPIYIKTGRPNALIDIPKLRVPTDEQQTG